MLCLHGELRVFTIFTGGRVDLHMHDLLLVSFTRVSFYLLIFVLPQGDVYSSSYHVEQRVGQAATHTINIRQQLHQHCAPDK